MDIRFFNCEAFLKPGSFVLLGDVFVLFFSPNVFVFAESFRHLFEKPPTENSLLVKGSRVPSCFEAHIDDILLKAENASKDSMERKVFFLPLGRLSLPGEDRTTAAAAFECKYGKGEKERKIERKKMMMIVFFFFFAIHLLNLVCLRFWCTRYIYRER